MTATGIPVVRVFQVIAAERILVAIADQTRRYPLEPPDGSVLPMRWFPNARVFAFGVGRI